MRKFVSFPLALTAALTFALTACGGNDDKASTPPPPAPTTTPSVTPSAPPAPTVDPASGLVLRSKEDLTTGLLELSDLPAGFSREADDDAEDESKPFTTTSSRCKVLVKYLNADEAPGTKASVTRSFSGGQEGPYIDFGLDAMGSVDKVASLRAKYADAVSSCSKVTMRAEGEGSTTMQVDEITAPDFGTAPFAYRLMGVSGPKRGLEYTALVTGVNDVILSIGVLAGDEAVLAAAAEAAAKKAEEMLKPAT
ncbi:hypothetical protein E1263_24000 [Kribbella antibiotica]|uniref:Sensor domain-containing protein n=1 Tax=Kribbella antibiotica TaxID=190195 RepID=A0A4R4ZG58_9ACTN|nr:hypothetical protein [Kribbella antibiotica]TDD57365.1 hypothetical protein E1263_24000 [Kribbella antibiotica]